MDLLMFLSQLPASPSSLRVMVWRRMKSAGALGLQNGVWVLPRSPEHERFLLDLLRNVESQSASGQIFIVQPANEAVQQDIQDRFRMEREEEYAEFQERSQEFLDEIEKESAKQKFTFAELEENEQDLQRLTTWLEKIQKRDFAGGEKKQAAAQTLKKCLASLEIFSTEVYNRQAPSNHPNEKD
ncbi:MAG: Chromate resistance protein ChrB [Omnitrophica WOR_2 bacterium]